MRKVLVIAAREYLAAIRTKAFLLSMIVVPLMMVVSVGLQVVLRGHVDIEDKHFAVIDRTPGGWLFPELERAAAERNQKDIYQDGKQVKPKFFLEKIEPSADDREAVAWQRYELSQRVHRGELFGFLDIGPDIGAYRAGEKASAGRKRGGSSGRSRDDQDPKQLIRYQSNRPTYRDFPEWADQVITDKVRVRRAQEAGVKLDVVERVDQPVTLDEMGLSRLDPQTELPTDPSEGESLLPFFVPLGLMGLMLFVMLGTTPLMQGVVEEKMQRIAEVLLGSVSPFRLMLGKLLGAVGVSLTTGGVYLAGALWLLHRFGRNDLLPPSLVVWFVVFQVLCVLLYGSIFIAIGSACTEMRETQTYLLPVMLLATLPMFVWINVVQEPNSTFATVMSFFPPSTPMLMVARMAVPPGVPVWQPAVGVLLVLLTTVACVWAAGRVFRVGILMQGKAARVGELVKWVVRG